MRTFAPTSTSASGTPSWRGRAPLGGPRRRGGAGGRAGGGGAPGGGGAGGLAPAAPSRGSAPRGRGAPGGHALLEHGGHRVLQPLRLLVELVPRDAEDVGEEALDQPVAADDGLRVLAPRLGEDERLVGRAGDVAVAVEAPDHLMDGRRR